MTCPIRDTMRLPTVKAPTKRRIGRFDPWLMLRELPSRTPVGHLEVTQHKDLGVVLAKSV
jgi:hypothetical protein